jgi:hypothetical protein
MDKFFELLPFIIGAIYLFGRKKKNVAPEVPTSEPNVPRKRTEPRRLDEPNLPRTKDRVPTLEDILRELSQEPKSVNPEITRPNPVKEIPKNISKPVQTPSRERKVKKIELIDEDANFLDKNSDREDFDLEKAIIAQAILERKYF